MNSVVPESEVSGHETRLTLTHLMLPADANHMGRIHGGIVLKLIDEAAAACAQRFCRSLVATAAIDRIDFHHPVAIGDLVFLHANVNFSGRTSMEVGVRVEAENLQTGFVTHTNSAYVVLVAIDADGKPIAVPRVTPRTDEQWAWHSAAEARRQKRLSEREAAAESRGYAPVVGCASSCAGARPSSRSNSRKAMSATSSWSLSGSLVVNRR